MRALVLEKPAPIETDPLLLCDLPLPQISEEEVLIRIRACGVCRTDLHIVEEEIPHHLLPLIPGHQIVGVVEEVGEKVKDLSPGELVGVPWLNRVCGRCRFCQDGRENLCESALFTGYDVLGGYAEYVATHQEAVYKLPEGYKDEELAPLRCGGVIGYRAYRMSGVKKGDTLGIFGFGSSAHLVAQIAKIEGVEIFVFTRSPEHQLLARDLGASFAGRAEDHPPHLLTSAIIFAPAGNLVKNALLYLERGGAVIMAGIYSTPLPEIPYSLLYWERSIKSVANSTRQDVRELLDFAQKHHLEAKTEIFPLTEANRVLQLLKESKIKASAVLKPET